MATTVQVLEGGRTVVAGGAGDAFRAEAAAAAALAHKETAEAASLTLPNVYASTAAGLAAVGANETFWVFDAGLIKLYRDVAGVAVLLDSLPLSTAVLAQRKFGDATTIIIDSKLAGAANSATGTPIFVGHNTANKDSVTLDAAGNWPAGHTTRRSAGTLVAPTPVTPGMQLGYWDFRAYNTDGGGGFYFNAASIDVQINGAIAFGDGDTPPTDMHFYTCWNLIDALTAGSFISYGPADGAGFWVGWTGVDGALSMQPTGGSKPRSFVVTEKNDWASMIDARPAAGLANGQRIDINKTTSSDFAQALFANGVLILSTRGDGVTNARDFEIKSQRRQAFALRITSTAGVLQHRIGAQLDGSVAGSFHGKINGASPALTNTPTGADASTAMAAGGKISSASPSIFILDVAAQTVADVFAAARIVFQNSGASLAITPLVVSRDVNGVTRNRLELQLRNPTSGAAVAWSTLTAGQTVDMQIDAYLA